MTVSLDTSVRLLRITYDARSRFQGMTLNGSKPALSYACMPGYSYSLRRSTNLVNWATLWTTNAPATGQLTFADTFGDLDFTAPPAAYYRLDLNP
jgi:hypothetical protein